MTEDEAAEIIEDLLADEQVSPLLTDDDKTALQMAIECLRGQQEGM